MQTLASQNIIVRNIKSESEFENIRLVFSSNMFYEINSNKIKTLTSFLLSMHA